MNELSNAKIKCPFDFGEKKNVSKYEAAYYDIRYCSEDCPFFECYENGIVHCFKVDIEKLGIPDMLMKADRIIDLCKEILNTQKTQNKKKRG